MDLLIAIQKYCDKLIEYNSYPKTKRPSLGKLEKLADLCVAGKMRKLSRYISKDLPQEQQDELKDLLKQIEEIVQNENKTN